MFWVASHTTMHQEQSRSTEVVVEYQVQISVSGIQAMTMILDTWITLIIQDFQILKQYQEPLFSLYFHHLTLVPQTQVSVQQKMTNSTQKIFQPVVLESPEPPFLIHTNIFTKKVMHSQQPVVLLMTVIWLNMVILDFQT